MVRRHALFALVLPVAAAALAAAAAVTGPDATASPARPLPFYYDLYSFRGDDGATDVVAAFAVPAGRLQEEDEDGGRYRFDVSLVLADTARGTVSRTDDSVYVSSPRGLPGEHLLHTFIEVEARPSATTVQRVVMTDATTPGIGQLYRSAFRIPDYGGRDLMLSDLALGLPDARSGWTRGGATLALLPTSHFPGEVFDLYYEVYNLPAGHRYTTGITIERVDDAGRVDEELPVRASFVAESRAGPEATLPELRRVDASLGPGRYRLTVRVDDQEDGRTASRSRMLRVRDGSRGATLVAACPAARGRAGAGCRSTRPGGTPRP